MRTFRFFVLTASLWGLAASAAGAQTLPSRPFDSPVSGPAQGRPDEGIKVHGRWTIELRNADGALASRHEFENALLPSGQTILASLLSGDGTFTRGFWIVWLTPTQTAGPHPCSGVGGCDLREPYPPTWAQPVISWPLQVTSVGSPANAVRLTGTITADQNGEIANVSTALFFGEPSGAGQSQGFSRKVLPAPIQVVAGQSIAITVVFSFS